MSENFSLLRNEDKNLYSSLFRIRQSYFDGLYTDSKQYHSQNHCNWYHAGLWYFLPIDFQVLRHLVISNNSED